MAKRAEWLKRVEEWQRSGKSAREFCEGREYSAKSLQWWRWQLGGSGRSTGRSNPVRFARVVRKRDLTSGANQAGVVVHVGGARVEVGASADREVVTTVLDVLLASAGVRA